MRDTDIAYLAGMIDADGYVTATSSQRGSRWYFGAQVGITGSRREPHDLASALFGGKVLEHEPTGERTHHRVQYHWQRGGKTAVPVIEAVLPYLRVKAVQAQLALDLQQELLEASTDSDDPFPWTPAGYDPTPGRLAVVADIRALHARRGQPGRTWDGYPQAVLA